MEYLGESSRAAISESSAVPTYWPKPADSGLAEFVSSSTIIADTAVQRILNFLGLHGKAFSSAFWISLPPALVALLVRILASEGFLPWFEERSPKYLNFNSSVWYGITGVLGFLVVFRASQAYGRYWQALTSVHLMQAEWFDACSALISFCAPPNDGDTQFKTKRLKHMIVRLFSMLNTAALLRLIEPGAANELVGDIELLDPDSLDTSSIKSYELSTHRVELVSQWVQHWIMKGMAEGSIIAAPPIVSRSYQELANGLVRYHDALKVKTICFPQQYQAVCELLLMIHWLITPFLVSLWVNSPFWCVVFTFFSVFTLWSLTRVSATIEVPFSTAQFVADAKNQQDRFNEQLRHLLYASAGPLPSLDSFAMQNQSLESDLVSSVQLKNLSAHRRLSEQRHEAESPNDVEASRDTGANCVSYTAGPTLQPNAGQPPTPRIEFGDAPPQRRYMAMLHTQSGQNRQISPPPAHQGPQHTSTHGGNRHATAAGLPQEEPVALGSVRRGDPAAHTEGRQRAGNQAHASHGEIQPRAGTQAHVDSKAGGTPKTQDSRRRLPNEDIASDAGQLQI